jgi:uncharacterized protein YciI
MVVFFVRAPPPRATFVQDMTEAERMVMNEHVAYWTGLAERGTVVVFGPVLDPKEVYGIAVVEVKDDAEMRALLANDPAVKAGVHEKDEFHPMSPKSFVRK